MKLRLASMPGKPARQMGIGLMVAAVLMAGLPAAAAEHAASGRTTSLDHRDTFASYEEELDATASQTLRRIDAFQLAKPARNASRLPDGVEIRLPEGEGHFRSARERVQRLLPVIGPILSKAGVPVQLAAVVLVESGGDPMALSPKGARGLWQLMPGTAREYGLIVNGETDQRLDVILSTSAAAEYLRDLYAEFHSWKLALAAYNAGDGAVHRAMARTGGVGFVTASRVLPVETQKYVPAVLQALPWFGGRDLSAPADRVRVQQVEYATSE